MKLIVLSVGEQIYSTKRIVEEAEHRGHAVRVVNHAKCAVLMGKGRPKIMYQGENIINFPDAIIPRIGASVGGHGAAVVNEFEMNGVWSCATTFGIVQAQNKLNTLQLLNRKNIPIPQTVFSIDPSSCDAQLDLLGGPPIIIKLHEGTQGLGVILAESRKSAKSIMDTFYKMNVSFLAQEFIEESNGEDIRAIVVGNKVIAAMKRKGNPTDFRSNLHRGGTAEPVSLRPEETKMALRVCKYLRLPIAGVDLIRAKHQSLLMEVNATPGIQGIEAYTKVNIAEEMIKFIEHEIRRKF